jgi:hypothetical protein
MMLALTWMALMPTASNAVPASSPDAFPPKDKAKMPAVRWDEQTRGCTFSRTNDGKFHYGLWSGDVGVTVSVDAQELEKVRRRSERFFGVVIEVRYRGQGTLDLGIEDISLEFVKHFRVVETSLDPEAFAQKVQDDADELDHQTARELEKHPEKKTEKETYMRAFQKDAAEMLEFVSKNSLRPAHLNAENQEVVGWVLFPTDSKWISGWKKQEEFILRVPLDGKVFEFPFKLPPKPGEALLRKRQ